MFIQIPTIAKHEWHPFTISSATELKNEVWVHVRSLGNWTKRLNKHFTNMAEEESKTVRKDFAKINKDNKSLLSFFAYFFSMFNLEFLTIYF